MRTVEVKTKEDIKLNVWSEVVKFIKDDKYARVCSWYERNTKKYNITYWVIGRECAVQTASNCKSEKTVISKVAKFLDL